MLTPCSLSETYEEKRHEHVAMLQKKEDEMRQMFVIRVKEKEAELKEAEKEVSKYVMLFKFLPSSYLNFWHPIVKNPFVYKAL